MRRSLYAIFVLVLGVAVVIAIVLISARPRRGAVQQAGEAPRVAAPEAHQGPIRLNPLVPPGPLQKGVTPEMATVRLSESTDSQIPAFTRHSFTVRHGAVVSLTFTNRSNPKLHYRHSWVLIKPGSKGRVVKESKKAGSANSWIPVSPDVLAHTQLLPPGKSETIIFKAPAKPGDYPFMCLFPGHENVMNGVLHVR